MSYFIEQILNLKKPANIIASLLIIASLIMPATSSYHLLTDPPKSNIAEADKNQFLNDWPAGYGVKEVVEILKAESSNQKVYVGTEGTFGLLPFAFQIYFYANHNIQIVGYWPVNSANIPQQVIDASRTQKTYFVFNENQQLIENKNLKFISRYQKGSGNSYMRLYEVIPEK